MNKTLFLVLGSVICCSLTAGCGSVFSTGASESTTEYEAGYDYENYEDYEDYEDFYEGPEHPEEYVKIKKYSGYKAQVQSEEVTQEEVDNWMEEDMQYAYSDVTDRDTVEEDDLVEISYKTILNGEVLEDFSYDNEIWSLSEDASVFLEEDFTEALIGKKVGTTFDFKGIFVEGAPTVESHGDKCTVRVTVNAIKEVAYPESVEEFVDFSDFESIEAYRKYAEEKARKSKEEKTEKDALSQIMNKIVEDAEQIKDFSAEQIDREIQTQEFYLENDMYNKIEDTGVDMDFDEYFKKYCPGYKDLEEYSKYMLKYNCVYRQLAEDIYQINPTEYQIRKLGHGSRDEAEHILLMGKMKEDNILVLEEK